MAGGEKMVERVLGVRWGERVLELGGRGGWI